jgi:hypothetical protein
MASRSKGIISHCYVRGMREDIEDYSIRDLTNIINDFGGSSAETASHQILEVGSRKNELADHNAY